MAKACVMPHVTIFDDADVEIRTAYQLKKMTPEYLASLANPGITKEAAIPEKQKPRVVRTANSQAQQQQRDTRRQQQQTPFFFFFNAR